MSDFDSFKSSGYTMPRPFECAVESDGVRQLVFDLTKQYLIEHEDALPLTAKLQLPFKDVPPPQLWSDIMNGVNESSALQKLLISPAIVSRFRSLLDAELEMFPISFFRAQFPWMERSVYSWHQDMGTWYASRVPWLGRYRPVTLWFSLNGADQENSLDIAVNSDRNQLFSHSHVPDQGSFRAEIDFDPEEKFEVFVPKCDADEGMFFSDLCLHRTRRGPGLRPRYSVDIRYYDPKCLARPDVPISFRLKRMYQMLIGRSG